jgi:hypothetical protein
MRSKKATGLVRPKQSGSVELPFVAYGPKLPSLGPYDFQTNFLQKAIVIQACLGSAELSPLVNPCCNLPRCITFDSRLQIGEPELHFDNLEEFLAMVCFNLVFEIIYNDHIFRFHLKFIFTIIVFAPLNAIPCIFLESTSKHQYSWNLLDMNQ